MVSNYGNPIPRLLLLTLVSWDGFIHLGPALQARGPKFIPQNSRENFGYCGVHWQSRPRGRQGEGILSLWFAGWPGSLAMSSRSVRDPASKTGWQHWRTSIRGWPLASTYTCMCIEMSKARGWIHQLSWLPNSQPAVTVSSEGIRGPIFFSSTQTHVEVQLYLWMPHLWVLPSNFTF